MKGSEVSQGKLKGVTWRIVCSIYKNTKIEIQGFRVKGLLNFQTKAKNFKPKMMKRIATLLLMICATSYYTQAQGCSDAGFCTIDSFKPHEHGSDGQVLNQFKVGLNYGAADYSINAIGTYLEYNRRFSDKLSVDAKLTALAQSGNDISVFGVSDLFLNGNYRITPRATVTAGFKIPFNALLNSD